MKSLYPMEKNDSATATLVDLHDRLDGLWTTYLHYLDQYTASQKLIQNHMSAGFMSLARANFNARNGVRRYGKDFFHERAIASRRVEVTMDENDGERTQVAIVQWHGDQGSDDTPPDSVVNESKAGTRDEVDPPTQQQQPSPPATPIPPQADDRSEGDDEEEEPANPNLQGTDSKIKESGTLSSSKSNPAIDPLRWFGILVPPDLRSAQTSFVSAVNDAMADAANTARRMRELEVEIRKLRKEVRRAEKVASS